MRITPLKRKKTQPIIGHLRTRTRRRRGNSDARKKTLAPTSRPREGAISGRGDPRNTRFVAVNIIRQANIVVPTCPLSNCSTTKDARTRSTHGVPYRVFATASSRLAGTARQRCLHVRRIVLCQACTPGKKNKTPLPRAQRVAAQHPTARRRR